MKSSKREMLVSWNSTEVDSFFLRLLTSLRVISFLKILLKALDSPLPTKKTVPNG